jgi:hypothetical protein
MTADATSPSQRMGGALGKLHPVTQLLVVAVVVYLVASLAIGVATLVQPSMAAQARPFAVRLAEVVRGLAYSLILFGTAASVEFLFRIWRELRLARAPD